MVGAGGGGEDAALIMHNFPSSPCLCQELLVCILIFLVGDWGGGGNTISIVLDYFLFFVLISRTTCVYFIICTYYSSFRGKFSYYSIRQQIFLSYTHTITATYTVFSIRVAKPHQFSIIYPTMAEAQGNGDGVNPEPVPSPTASEPPTSEHENNGDDSTSPPGSLPLVSEHGNPRFPRDLQVGGGFEILSNPINVGYSEWLVSATVLDLHTSIKAVLLNLVENALQNRDKKMA